jgi:hypothetical protein
VKSFKIYLPYQDEKHLAQMELLVASGRLQEREEIQLAVEKSCICEARKLYACTCEIYVRDLLKTLKGETK